jgi:arabinose-5-phosphate isomerase
LDARGCSADDFARSHPGGSLGRRLLTHVADVMRKGADMPAVREDATFKQAVLEMSRGRMGMTAVLGGEGEVLGIFTDGDLRRALDKVIDFEATLVRKIMTAAPRTIRPEALAVEAVQLMERHKVNQLLVVDERGRLVGALNMHDLFRAKVL